MLFSNQKDGKMKRYRVSLYLLISKLNMYENVAHLNAAKSEINVSFSSPSSCYQIFAFSFQKFCITLHTLINWSRNISSWKIGIHSPFGRHKRIFRLLPFVNKMIEKIKVYKEAAKTITSYAPLTLPLNNQTI